jgi:hypothetical protein
MKTSINPHHFLFCGRIQSRRVDKARSAYPPIICNLPGGNAALFPPYIQPFFFAAASNPRSRASFSAIFASSPRSVG